MTFTLHGTAEQLLPIRKVFKTQSLVIFTEHILDTCMRNVEIIKKKTNKLRQKEYKTALGSVIINFDHQLG